MPVDELIWDVLGTRLDPGEDGPPDSSRREAAVQLLDAALAALAATGHLVSVAELVLHQQRDRLAAPAGDSTPNPAGDRRPIDLTY